MRNLGDLVLRHATEKDLNRVLRFSIDKLHYHNAKRTLDRISETIRYRKFFIVEDDNTKNIYAVSGVFDHIDGKYRQAGGTRVTVMGGFGIHKILHRVRAVHETVMDGEYSEYFVAIESDNEVSIENAKAVGFVHWDNPDVKLKYESITQSNKDLTFLKLHRNNINEMAAWILNHMNGKELKRVNKDNQEEEKATLNLKLEVIQYFESVLKTMAFGS